MKRITLDPDDRLVAVSHGVLITTQAANHFNVLKDFLGTADQSMIFCAKMFVWTLFGDLSCLSEGLAWLVH